MAEACTSCARSKALVSYLPLLLLRLRFQRPLLLLSLSFQGGVLSELPRLRRDYKEPAFSRTKSIMMLLGKNAKGEVEGFFWRRGVRIRGGERRVADYNVPACLML